MISEIFTKEIWSISKKEETFDCEQQSWGNAQFLL